MNAMVCRGPKNPEWTDVPAPGSATPAARAGLPGDSAPT